MTIRKPTFFSTLPAIITLIWALLFGAANAVEIEQIITPSGLKVYHVEDYSSPIITLSFSFAGGSSQDPSGKAGVGRLLASMLDEGAGELSGPQFQAMAEELGVDISFSVERDYFTGTMQTLSANADEAMELLRISINQPRFDQQPLERMRHAILQSVMRAKTRPQSVASKAMRETLFNAHPYGQPTSGTTEELEKLTREDLIALHRKLLVKDGLIIGVVGAVSGQKLAEYIDLIFAPLPRDGGQTKISEAKIELGEVIEKSMDTPQTQINLVLPGLKRSDPDFFAAYLANHILGGGTFSSRLFDAVREKRGLTYSIYSSIATYDHAAFTVVSSATSPQQADEAIAVIRAELQRMARDGPSEAELAAAKKYIIGSYAIRNLDTSVKVADVLVGIQQVNLGIDYIDRREAIINAVSLADVKRVAAELFGQKPTMIVVGPAKS